MREIKDARIEITVVIPVKNEEKNLERCLNALRRFTEIIVVDSGSTDRTRDMAEGAGVRVIDFIWNGRYPKKRNWVLSSQTLANEWVLFLDADEVVNDRFCDEVGAAINSGQHVGFWLNYTNYFIGRRLRYGVPQRKLALFKVGFGSYERIEEDCWSGLDMEVHEHPVIDGSVGEIDAKIDHRDFRGVDKFLLRHIDYAMWEARRYLELRSGSESRSSQLTLRQRFKYRNLERPWYSTFYFCFAFFFRAGFLDGGAGYAYAFYKAWYFYTVRLMILELRDRETSCLTRT